MRILVVCQHFFPENFRINDECFEFVKKGNEVTVLTGLPNYPEGIVNKEYRHHKKRNEYINGVKIERVFLIGRGKNLFTMALNYISFAVFGCIKAIKLKEKFDVIYVYQLSPISMVWPGILIKWKQKIPLIIHCLDQWPISLTMGPIDKNSLIYRLALLVSRWTYNRADVITVSSKSFKKYFANELKISAQDKGVIYFPSYAEEIYCDVGWETNDTFDVVFAGNVGPAQNCEMIIDVAENLRYVQDIVFHIVGDGLNLQNCKDKANKLGLENVKFYGYHSIDEMQDYYKLADAFLITMQNNEVVNNTLPAKLQSYMLAGKPIFGAINGEVMQVVKEAECGICVNSDDYQGLADIIRSSYQDDELLARWGKNGVRYYENHFRKSDCIDRRINLFEGVIG